jgi:hypothetical protein
MPSSPSGLGSMVTKGEKRSIHPASRRRAFRARSGSAGEETRLGTIALASACVWCMRRPAARAAGVRACRISPAAVRSTRAKGSGSTNGSGGETRLASALRWACSRAWRQAVTGQSISQTEA